MIKENFPALDDITITMLSKKTTGLWREQIPNAVKEYIESGALPEGREVKSGECPYCHPVHGESPEYAIFPLEMGKDLQSLGFKVKIYLHPGVRKPFRYFRPIFNFSPIVFLKIARSFKIMAVKL